MVRDRSDLHRVARDDQNPRSGLQRRHEAGHEALALGNLKRQERLIRRQGSSELGKRGDQGRAQAGECRVFVSQPVSQVGLVGLQALELLQFGRAQLGIEGGVENLLLNLRDPGQRRRPFGVQGMRGFQLRGPRRIELVEQHAAAHALGGVERELQILFRRVGRIETLQQIPREPIVRVDPLGKRARPHCTLRLEIPDRFHRFECFEIGFDGFVPPVVIPEHLATQDQAPRHVEAVADRPRLVDRLLQESPRPLAVRIQRVQLVRDEPHGQQAGVEVSRPAGELQGSLVLDDRRFPGRSLPQHESNRRLELQVARAHGRLERSGLEQLVLVGRDFASVPELAGQQGDVVTRAGLLKHVSGLPVYFGFPVVVAERLTVLSQSPADDSQSGENLRLEAGLAVPQRRLLGVPEETPGPAVVHPSVRLKRLSRPQAGQHHRVTGRPNGLLGKAELDVGLVEPILSADQLRQGEPGIALAVGVAESCGPDCGLGVVLLRRLRIIWLHDQADEVVQSERLRVVGQDRLEPVDRFLPSAVGAGGSNEAQVRERVRRILLHASVAVLERRSRRCNRGHRGQERHEADHGARSASPAGLGRSVHSTGVEKVREVIWAPSGP